MLEIDRYMTMDRCKSLTSTRRKAQSVERLENDTFQHQFVEEPKTKAKLFILATKILLQVRPLMLLVVGSISSRQADAIYRVCCYSPSVAVV